MFGIGLRIIDRYLTSEIPAILLLKTLVSKIKLPHSSSQSSQHVYIPESEYSRARVPGTEHAISIKSTQMTSKYMQGCHIICSSVSSPCGTGLLRVPC